jgi:hypothetical protein
MLQDGSSVFSKTAHRLSAVVFFRAFLSELSIPKCPTRRCSSGCAAFYIVHVLLHRAKGVENYQIRGGFPWTSRVGGVGNILSVPFF